MQNTQNNSAPTYLHESVLLEETVHALLNQDNTLPKIYIDATFGRGGHSQHLLAKMQADDTLIVFDKDPTAIQVAKDLAAQDKRIKVVHQSFATLAESLSALGIHQVDGIMADLGVSSPQLDDASRGFSFMQDGTIDMRMNNHAGITAGEWLQTVSEEELANVLYNYGDERYSRRIAKAIKAMDSYDSTLQLAETIKTAHPKWEKNKHPATKSFQAIRIHINNELGDIDTFLDSCIPVLKTDAALAVISFHSLEDKRIKQFFQKHSKGHHPGDENLPIAPIRPKLFGKPKRIKASDAEVKNNPRSRSAWLRTAMRTSEQL